MFTSLIEKYGIVPKSAMPETIISSKTGESLRPDFAFELYDLAR